MNRDEFYAAMAPRDDARLRKVLWIVYWRGNAQLRERIEDELRPQERPAVKPKKQRPDPAGAGQAAALNYLIPVVAVALGWAVLAERPPWLAMAGGGCAWRVSTSPADTAPRRP